MIWSWWAACIHVVGATHHECTSIAQRPCAYQRPVEPVSGEGLVSLGTLDPIILADHLESSRNLWPSVCQVLRHFDVRVSYVRDEFFISAGSILYPYSLCRAPSEVGTRIRCLSSASSIRSKHLMMSWRGPRICIPMSTEFDMTHQDITRYKIIASARLTSI